jgi:hypothetical protein
MIYLPPFRLIEKVEPKDQAHSMRYSISFDASSDECAILTFLWRLHCPGITDRFIRSYPGACVYSPQHY